MNNIQWYLYDYINFNPNNFDSLRLIINNKMYSVSTDDDNSLKVVKSTTLIYLPYYTAISEKEALSYHSFHILELHAKKLNSALYQALVE